MGISLEEFNEMTPKEFRLYGEVFTEKTEQKGQEKMMLAWMGAYWQRVEKLEPLENYLKKNEPENLKSMSTEDMLVKVMELNVKMGGTVVKPGGD